MANIKQVLQKSGVPAVRLVWKVRKGEEKPKTYQTFQRITQTPTVSADDQPKVEAETWYVRIITKEDYEDLVDTTVKNLREAGFYVPSIDQETYEPETGYWIVPITAQIIKE